jgi:predicted  nucleic acid-binding Zn-ribbon protein
LSASRNSCQLPIDEAKEAAETKRTLEGELKRAQAPVKAKQRELQAIEREQGHAARSLQNAKKHLQEEREKILAASGQSDEAKRAVLRHEMTPAESPRSMVKRITISANE